MKKLLLPIVLIVFGFSLVNTSCKNKNRQDTKSATGATSLHKADEALHFDSILVNPFFIKYPKLKKYQPDVIALYHKHQYQHIWYDRKGIIEVGHLLYNKINNIEEEGLETTVPYKEKLDDLFQSSATIQKPNATDELFLSSLYFFYTNKVLKGLDTEKMEEMEWYLPRKKQSYITYLDSLLINPDLIHKNEEVLGEYYRLKEALKEYRQIKKNNQWNPIVPDTNSTTFMPGDSSQTIAQIRQRLFALGDLQTDSKSAVYDRELVEGVLKYKKRNGKLENDIITSKNIENMNIPIEERIKTIMVNMERCRWISNDLSKAKELIVINIPAYQLTYFKDGKPELVSNVVVGKAMNKTVIFSADMKYIVFSPYWNVPKSIIEKEIAPEIAKNRNYLAQNNMEWYDGSIRQKPGPKNSLGLVKFLFPNTRSIYLHDTPAKSLFDREKRAFSHGCIRVAKPKELANLILKDDENWTPEKIDAAMNAGKESWYALKKKIPVYIGYFTAWVDTDGIVHFYDDVYERDQRLATMLFEE